ncbi:MAG: hypothetical protein KKG47_14195 [Proteobacteria bacterium]|nr:hypothetical protein [Pseudomonadota bacterium]MBU1739864.1 hypothetical protein [Pseudomonadota bacterium]
MGNVEEIQPKGDRVKKAMRWVCETLRDEPGKDRSKLVKEAAIRFDLTPSECQYLEKGTD